MADKITISTAEVNSAAVDAKLSERTAGGAYDASDSSQSGGVNWKQILYNTLVYSTLFGLGGGLVAGVTGEVFWAMAPATLEEYVRYKVAHDELTEQLDSGEITQLEYELETGVLGRRFADNRLVASENDPSVDQMVWLEELDEVQTREGIRNLVIVVLWFASVGMILALCLSVADQAMGHNLRGVMVNGSVALALALLGTAFGGCVASIAYNQLGGGDSSNFLLQVFARSIGWGLFGGCLSVAPGIVLKNWKRLAIGLAGGLIGGAFGGALFDPIGAFTGNAVVSRLVAIVVIGTLTGLGTGLLENAAKTGWVRVIQGLIAGKQFILYKDSTHIGSSPQCEIYLFKDADISPRHAAIHKRGGRHELEDLRSHTGTFVNGSPISRTQLKKGDQIRIGSTVMVFLEKARQ